ncbi:MAG: head completion/stabilization protein, partial [Rhizomicrobium sp.]
MAFVALPDDPATEAGSTQAPPVTNDGFFPDIDLAAIRDIARVPSAVTDERLRASVIAAIITVARDLDAWAAAQKVASHARLSDVPAVQIDGASRLIHLYNRAVAMFTKAELIERMRDFDTTG